MDSAVYRLHFGSIFHNHLTTSTVLVLVGGGRTGRSRVKTWLPRALQTTEACRASTERDKKWPRALRKAIRPVISGLYVAILLHLAQDRSCTASEGCVLAVRFRHAPCPNISAAGGWIAGCRVSGRDGCEPRELKTQKSEKAGAFAFRKMLL